MQSSIHLRIPEVKLSTHAEIKLESFHHEAVVWHGRTQFQHDMKNKTTLANVCREQTLYCVASFLE